MQRSLQTIQKVSVHGGHSGQFCLHAKNNLEEVVEAYIAQGFSWVGITEHMPPMTDDHRYPDEAEHGITSDALQKQFARYFTECRALQEKYADRIKLFTAFETETYPGSVSYIQKLMKATKPDYIVGSVHHVGGNSIDVNSQLYEKAKMESGDLEQLYCNYFDAQLTMLGELEPSVVGHFDLIRIFDSNYLETLQLHSVWARVVRNLELIAELDLILDFNLRGFDKTVEQYPSLPVLKKAIELGIAIVPGDDSHGVNSVGRNYDRGVALLAELGHNCQWREPRVNKYL
ncbi:MAG: histidinol-phosphatase [Pseudomonadota bacterium]